MSGTWDQYVQMLPDLRTMGYFTLSKVENTSKSKMRFRRISYGTSWLGIAGRKCAQDTDTSQVGKLITTVQRHEAVTLAERGHNSKFDVQFLLNV